MYKLKYAILLTYSLVDYLSGILVEIGILAFVSSYKRNEQAIILFFR